VKYRNKNKAQNHLKNKQDPNYYYIHARVWINKGDKSFLGQGRIDLLELVDRFGSISEAARAMKMSYRHAWELVDSMNQQAPQPLVKKTTGGKGGGGTQLTPIGKTVLNLYKDAQEKIDTLLVELEKKLNNEFQKLTENS